jgi:3'(2'), 5'-bisphosphate nucleotidase
MREPSRFLKSVVELTREAGLRILRIYHSDFRVGFKVDRTPLTAADLAAHHHLVEGLGRLRPIYPVLSEECSEVVSAADRGSWETYWLIDPLDGTREFIKRNGEFTVNVALVHQRKPVLGVVYAPVLDTCYFASEHCGAFKQVDGGACRVIEVSARTADPPRVVGSRSHQTGAMTTYLGRLGPCDLMAVGSSLKFCLVADGSADLYPRLGLTSEWDTAAAQCIVEAAGGRVTDLAGRRLEYNRKASLLNPFFLAYGDTSRDWARFAEGIVG